MYPCAKVCLPLRVYMPLTLALNPNPQAKSLIDNGRTRNLSLTLYTPNSPPSNTQVSTVKIEEPPVRGGGEKVADLDALMSKLSEKGFV